MVTSGHVSLVQKWNIRMEPGNVIWITGISGSGKTTLGRRITNWLRENGEMVVFLDGDELRKIFDGGSKFDYQSRLSLSVSYSKLCKILSDSGLTVVICTISLFHFVHRWNRENISHYVEVFIDAPLNLVRSRDPKGIYEKYFKGELSNVSGLDIDAEYPANPHIKLNVDLKTDVEDSLEQFKRKFKTNKFSK